MHKNVSTKRATFTKAEREYVKGIIHNLSLQRLTDREIVEWLHNEKAIVIDRSTVSRIRNQMENDAEKWYIGLRNGAKYIATYKERLDALLSYQKELHQLINDHSSPELVIRAISELHRIELSLHMLMKELPGDITTSKDIAEKQDKENKKRNDHMTFDEWLDKNDKEPRVMNDSDYSDEENGKYYWDLHKRYNKYVDEWKNQMFGPDTEPVSIVWSEAQTESAQQQIVQEETEIDPVDSTEPILELKIMNSESESEKSTESNIVDDDRIEGAGQKHELGIHCTQCHRIYFNRVSYNKHECMRLVRY